VDDAVGGVDVGNDDFGVVVDVEVALEELQTGARAIGHGHITQRGQRLLGGNLAVDDVVEQDVGQLFLGEGGGDVVGVEAQLGEGIIGGGEDGPLAAGERIDQVGGDNGRYQRFKAVVANGNFSDGLVTVGSDGTAPKFRRARLKPVKIEAQLFSFFLP
jgi:hypothetical protein